MSQSDSPLSLPFRVMISGLGMLSGVVLAYGYLFEFPHLELSVLEDRRDAAILAIEHTEPGLQITQGGRGYVFNPGLTPEIYGAEAGRICGDRGDIGKLEMFADSSLLDQGYESCAELMMIKHAVEARQEYRTLTEIFQMAHTGGATQ